MRKTFAILAGGLALAIAFNSCKNDNSAEQAIKDNLKIDSTVNVRLATLRQSLKDDCQKSYMVKAQAMADSIINIATKKGAIKKPVTKPSAPAPAPQKPGGLKGLSDQSQQPTGKGLKGMSDQSKEQQQTKKGLKGLSDQSKNDSEKK